MSATSESPDSFIHRSMVAELCKPGEVIRADLTADQAHLLHMAVGVAGEAGELLDAIKKHAIYGLPLNLPNVIEELGDIEFYMEGLRSKLNLNRDNVLAGNVTKLRKRYGTRYSKEAAAARADKEQP